MKERLDSIAMGIIGGLAVLVFGLLLVSLCLIFLGILV